MSISIDEYLPEYFKETADDIHSRMLREAPEGINTIEGDIFWSATRPCALEIVKAKKVALLQVLKLGILQTTTGKFLDLKGEADGIPRKDGSATIQKIEIKAAEGTRISAGRVVCTVGTEEEKSIEFIVQDTVVVDSTGITTVKAECTQIGTIGNVAPGNIKMLTQTIDGVISVLNVEIIKDGVDVESDEDYLVRILENAQNPPTSANIAHYKKWAKEYPGVKDCKVIPLWDGNGTVKIILVADGNKPTSEELVKEVKTYIDPYPEGEGRGKAPIGATVTVVSCVEKSINIKADLVLKDGYSIEIISDSVKNSIENYLQGLDFNTTDYISYARVGNAILTTDGIIDYSNMLIDDNNKNVTIAENEIVTVGNIEIGEQ